MGAEFSYLFIYLYKLGERGWPTKIQLFILLLVERCVTTQTFRYETKLGAASVHSVWHHMNPCVEKLYEPECQVYF